jgi:hypothetical protein
MRSQEIQTRFGVFRPSIKKQTTMKKESNPRPDFRPKEPVVSVLGASPGLIPTTLQGF